MKTTEEKNISSQDKTEWYEAAVPMDEYLESCVDIPTFSAACKACPNYGRHWSCPPFSFDPEKYWKNYKTLLVVGIKIRLPEEMLSKTYTDEEQMEVMDAVLFPVKKRFDRELLKREKDYPGSVSLSGGSCQKCGADNCARLDGKPCRYPDEMRYSIEALGGNVGLTVTKYLHQKLLWMDQGRLPEYFMLIGGLLLPE